MYPNLLCKFLGIFGRHVQVGWKYVDLNDFGEISIIGDPYISLEDAIKAIELWEKWETEPKYHYL